MVSWVKSLLTPPVFPDEEKTRQAQLAYVVAMLFVVAPGIYGLYRWFGEAPTTSVTAEGAQWTAWLPPLGVSLLSVFLLLMIRRGRVKLASGVLVLSVWLGFAVMSINLGGVRDASYSAYMMVIMLTGLLLGGRFTVVMVAVTLGLGWALVNAETNGLLPLDQDTPTEVFINYAALFLITAGLITVSNRGFRALLGRLQAEERAVRARNWELQQMRDSLERRVAERTEDLDRRSRYLEAAARVAYAAGEILDVDELMNESVNLIRDAFGLYYVGLFVVDPAGEWALLRAGTGEPGRRMLARGHRIRVGEGMIGWSVEHRESRFAQHAEEDQVRLVAPELPETRAEAALPLRARDRVLGALTVQSAEPDFFDEDVVTVLQTMADLLAVALNNAELFAESERAMAAVRRAYGDVAADAWGELLRERGAWGYRYAEGLVSPSEGDWDRATLQALEARDIVRVAEGSTTSVAIPLRVGGEVIGAINYQRREEGEGWGAEDIELLTALTEQFAQALDSARLYEQTQRSAARERVAREITDRMRATVDFADLMETAVREIGEALDASRAFVQWVPPQRKPVDITEREP
ncbi:MAG: GAF domain-containing protein [Anaerolineae bacterium]